MAIELKVRQWGNSLGIVLPKRLADDLKIMPNEDILVEIKKKKNPLKELFGAIKFSKKGKEIVKDSRKELEGQWLK